LIFNSIFNDGLTKFIKISPYSLLVNENTNLVKIHYLFMKLGLENIFVENNQGELVGYIDKLSFLKYKAS